MNFFLKFIKQLFNLINQFELYNSNIFKNKSSDRLFILGSGSSINKIKFWDHIKQHDSIGFNYFLFHSFIPKFYIFESTYKNNEQEYSAQLEIVKRKSASYKKVRIFLKMRDGYQDIKKILKKKK